MTLHLCSQESICIRKIHNCANDSTDIENYLVVSVNWTKPDDKNKDMMDAVFHKVSIIFSTIEIKTILSILH